MPGAALSLVPPNAGRRTPLRLAGESSSTKAAQGRHLLTLWIAGQVQTNHACAPRAMLRPHSGSVLSKSGTGFESERALTLKVTRFLHANRFPLRSKTL